MPTVEITAINSKICGLKKIVQCLLKKALNKDLFLLTRLKSILLLVLFLFAIAQNENNHRGKYQEKRMNVQVLGKRYNTNANKSRSSAISDASLPASTVTNDMNEPSPVAQRYQLSRGTNNGSRRQEGTT